MEEKIDKALEILIAGIRTNLKPDEALKQTQALQNAMHARGEWVAMNSPAYTGAKKTKDN
jgi:hypothetical protein